MGGGGGGQGGSIGAQRDRRALSSSSFSSSSSCTVESSRRRRQKEGTLLPSIRPPPPPPPRHLSSLSSFTPFLLPAYSPLFFLFMYTDHSAPSSSSSFFRPLSFLALYGINKLSSSTLFSFPRWLRTLRKEKVLSLSLSSFPPFFRHRFLPPFPACVRSAKMSQE